MDDSNSEYLKFGAVAGGMVVIFYQLLFNSGLMFGNFSGLKLFIGIVLGLAVGAGVFFGMKKMQG
jgi:hypothetical protein